MQQSLIVTVFILISSALVGLPVFSTENTDEIKIIERINFQKKLSVKNLTNAVDGKLKNYWTFSFYVSDSLIFCHLSKKKTEPRVICH